MVSVANLSGEFGMCSKLAVHEKKQQAVAALQIAEEARARAQAAKTAAEEAMNEALDHHHTHKKSEYLNQACHEIVLCCGLTSCLQFFGMMGVVPPPVVCQSFVDSAAVTPSLVIGGTVL